MLIELAKGWFGLPGGAAVRSCYEARRDGFRLHPWLKAHAVDNGVVEASSIEANRRVPRAKTAKECGSGATAMFFHDVLAALLGHQELAVLSARAGQLFMRARRHQAAAVQHQDEVRTADRRRAV